KKIAVAGGAPRTLADVTSSFGATWISDHTIAFVPLGSVIQQVSDEGGEPVRLTKMLPGELEHAWPGHLPGGGIFFAASTVKDRFISVQALDTGARKDFKGQLGTMPRYVTSGHLVYDQGGTLMAVPFDLRTLEVSRAKPAVPVVKGIWQGRDFGTKFTVSANGSLAYVPGQAQAPLNRLVWVSRTGAVSPLNAPLRFYYQPTGSPDGQRAVSDVLDESIQVWMLDLDRGTSAPFTFDGSNRHGVWTRDSTRVIFQSDRDGTQRLYWQSANGSGHPEPLMRESQPASDGVFNMPYSVAADGTLSYVHLVPTKNAQFLAMQLPSTSPYTGTPTVRQFMESGGAADGAPQLSPDGRWVAYAADESGRGRE